MSGIYKAPGGQLLHGDGKPIGRPYSTQCRELAAMPCSALIASTPEHGVGEQDMTFRMAANAVWNKLNFAMSLHNSPQHAEQMYALINEARALADSIVQHPDSGKTPNVAGEATASADVRSRDK